MPIKSILDCLLSSWPVWQAPFHLGLDTVKKRKTALRGTKRTNNNYM